MRVRARTGLILATSLPLLLTGCAPAMPAYSEVKESAIAAAQFVLAQLPSASIEANPNSEPYACDAAGRRFTGEGLFYTGQWLATLESGFDTEAFVKSLPATAPPEFRVVDTGVATSWPSVDFTNGDEWITVMTGIDDDGAPLVDVLVMSSCGRAEGE